jgi:hypothetical protein
MAMIEFDTTAVSLSCALPFAELVAKSARAMTGMDFDVRSNFDGSCEVVTSHPDAIQMEYGTHLSLGGSWSVRSVLEAERIFNEHASGGFQSA